MAILYSKFAIFYPKIESQTTYSGNMMVHYLNWILYMYRHLIVPEITNFIVYYHFVTPRQRITCSTVMPSQLLNTE